VAWESLIRGDCDEGEREHKQKALLEYCTQDTLGMLRLVEKLQQVSSWLNHYLRPKSLGRD
jgi:hypothetical protein